MDQQSIIPKDRFIGLDGIAHLCTGGEAPMLKSSGDALARFATLKSGGMAGRAAIIDVYEETRVAMADYLRAPGGVDDIAFLGHAAEGMNVLANGIDWQDGDEVVSIIGEYPDSLLPWLARRPRGVSLVTVEAGDGVEDRIAAAMTGRTRVVCVSYISYLTGFRIDLARLAEIAHARGAILAVDASHALGALPIPIEHCDVLVSCFYKFALATHGAALFYADRRRLQELQQPAVGWFSVEWPGVAERSETYRLKPGTRRFELGNPSFVSLFVLHEALALLGTISPERIQDHVWALGDRLREGLVGQGLDVWTPEARERRGTNIAFASEDADAVVERLRERGVLAWSGDGRVRFSLHGYNDASDVDAALRALPEVL